MGNPGTFNRKVSFQVPTTTKTSMGAPQKGFAHSFYAYCSRVATGNNNEQYVNNRLVVPGRFLYRTHYKSTIDETMRIADESVNYNILQATPDDMKMFIDIIAEKVTE